LREVCQEITGRVIGVKIGIRNQPSSDGPTKEDEAKLDQQLLRERAEQNPMVRQMLRTFRGEIVDVRRTKRQDS
jgi:hypothetical protein